MSYSTSSGAQPISVSIAIRLRGLFLGPTMLWKGLPPLHDNLVARNGRPVSEQIKKVNLEGQRIWLIAEVPLPACLAVAGYH